MRFPWLFVATLVSVHGCKKDEPAPVPPPEPPLINISSVRSTGGAELSGPDGGCLELGTDADRTIVVVVGPTDAIQPSQLEGWTLRPAGGCDGDAACGFLWLELLSGGKLVQSVASAVTAVPLAVGSAAPGAYTLRVELRDDDGAPLAFVDGAPVVATLDLELAEARGCGLGGGGAGGQGGSAGAPSGGALPGGAGAGGAAAAPGAGTAGAAGIPAAAGAAGAAGAPGGFGAAGAAAGAARAGAGGVTGGGAGGGVAAAGLPGG